MVNFHHFVNMKKGHQHQQRIFSIYKTWIHQLFHKKYNFTMCSWTCNQNIEIFFNIIPSYMVYNQNVSKFASGWCWRTPQNWKKKKIIKNCWCPYCDQYFLLFILFYFKKLKINIHLWIFKQKFVTNHGNLKKKKIIKPYFKN